MKKSIFALLTVLVVLLFSFSCKNANSPEPENLYPSVSETVSERYSTVSVTKSVETSISELDVSDLGETFVTVTDNGFETAIHKKCGDVTVTFLIVNPDMNTKTINTSVSYINSTKKIVSNMTMTDWYNKCKTLSSKSLLVTDCGYVEFNGELVYMFNVAHNVLYLELFKQ